MLCVGIQVGVAEAKAHIWSFGTGIGQDYGADPHFCYTAHAADDVSLGRFLSRYALIPIDSPGPRLRGHRWDTRPPTESVPGVPYRRAARAPATSDRRDP
jgi:hypothetical protein